MANKKLQTVTAHEDLLLIYGLTGFFTVVASVCLVVSILLK